MGHEHERFAHLLRLSGEDAKGELAELRRAVIEQQLREHHPWADGVHTHVARRLLNLKAGHAVSQLLDQRVSELGQATLGGAVGGVSGRAAALDGRAAVLRLQECN